MQSLFFDIASHEAVIACVSEQSVTSIRTCGNRVSDHELIPLIEEVLKEGKWKYTDLTHIACVIGPGGFTSLRIAAACANTLSHQLKIPVARIHLSDLYTARAESDDFFWLHSTKKAQLFVRGGKWKEPTLIPVEELPDAPWAGELIDEHRQRIESDPVALRSVADVLPSVVSGAEYDMEIVKPWYGRGF